MNSNLQARDRKVRQSIVVAMSGDSGDGVQLIGDLCTRVCASHGLYVISDANFPAEIRAPVGTLSGVSILQLHISAEKISSPGDTCDYLLAFGPAAFFNLKDRLSMASVVLVNEDQFTPQNFNKIGLSEASLLEGMSVNRVPMTSLTQQALTSSPLGKVQRERCKNFFALGLLSWLWQLDQDGVEIEIKKTFAKANETCLANLTAFRAGLAHGIHLQQGITPISLPSNPGIKEKRISTDGNQAMVAALLMASQKSKRQLFFGGYPITPASSILEKLSQCSAKSVHVFQGEDEIAAIGAALGAAYGGALAATATSGPGFVLKQEFINFAVMAELPLVIINVQRAGPSTGMPTKTEQSDLNCALYGRNGDSPLVVLAARSPVDCFDTCYEAARIAIKYMTPVIVLSDSFLATSAETWSFPDWNTLEDFPLVNVQGKTDDTSPFLPYARDPKTLARAWIEPGEVGHTHRIGGLEKGGESGDVSYDPLNHQKMTELRAQKIANIAKELPKTEVIGNGKSDVLVVCWGSSYGAFCEAAKKLYDHPLSFACIAPQCLNPLPLDLGDILSQFATVIVAEQNYGQLVDIIRAKYLRPCHSFTKIQGRPFTFVEIKSFLQSLKAPQNSSEGDVS